MPELNHRFQAGRMNKDLDERLVPNGEYRDALNVEVAASEDSDVGTVQTILGNIDLSSRFIGDAGYCVGSIVDEKNDKIYWLISGDGRDIIAEYDWNTKSVEPVMVEIFPINTPPGNDSGRVLNFDPEFLITGINIIDGMLFWTDDNTEPKRIHIQRSKEGSISFNSTTNFLVRRINEQDDIFYESVGPIQHEHITVIKKSPPAAPVLEMKYTKRGDVNQNTITGEITATLTVDGNPFLDDEGNYETSSVITTPVPFDAPGTTDFEVGDYIIISTTDDNGTRYEIRAIIEGGPNEQVSVPPQPTDGWYIDIQIISGDPNLVNDNGFFDVELEQKAPLFQFKFPRFGYRYKYEDGEYSAFSPFTEVAFLPDEFDYLPKEGYNLGMVNTLRFLAVKDFVHERQIPDDVISIDILYKESNSPNVYSVKTVKRSSYIAPGAAIGNVHEEWNADSLSTMVDPTTGFRTKGYVQITSELIHAVLPSNQLLRPWDNVPRKALAQEIVGNRLVYGNYLQNYNLANTSFSGVITSNALLYDSQVTNGELRPDGDITVDLRLKLKTGEVGSVIPEQFDPINASLRGSSTYGPSKSIKTLRTYQIGVVYIDEFGRETPVFSDSISDRNSIYVPKETANKAAKLAVQPASIVPDFAKSFKFFIKETSNEYYNLAMDRWYDAEDGNIWLSFPSSERNKVDLETFLILKKEHDNDNFVPTPARYKIIAIENEAPIFIKTRRIQKGSFRDDKTLMGTSANDFPLDGVTNIKLDQATFEGLGWAKADPNAVPPAPGGIGTWYGEDLTLFQVRFSTVAGGYSKFFDVQSIEHVGLGNGYYKIVFSEPLPDGISSITSLDGSFLNRHSDVVMDLAKKEVHDLAEFDGRFFAKIKKDIALIDTIIKPGADGSSGWNVDQSIISQYINPSQPSGAWDWYGSPMDINNGDEYEIAVSEHNSNSDGRNSQGFAGRGQDYWTQASNTAGMDLSTNSSGWFIDKVEGFRRFRYNEMYFGPNSDPGYSTNEDTSSLSANAAFNNAIANMFQPITFGQMTPWQQDNQMQLIGTGTAGTNANYTVNSGAPNYLNLGGCLGPRNDLRTNVSVHDDGQILPSVGIDQTHDVIHLSYSGIGLDNIANGNYGGGGAEQMNYFGLWNGMKDHVNDIAFITAITTPGTVWRWAEDPGKCVYRTMQYVDNAWTLNGDTVSINEWDYNTTDQTQNELGVGLYNYTKFQDYPIVHHHKFWDTILPFPPGAPFSHEHVGWLSQFFAPTASAVPPVGPNYGGPGGNAQDPTHGCWNFFNPTCHCPSCSANPGHWLAAVGLEAADHRTAGGWYSGIFGNPNAHCRWPQFTQEWHKPINRRRRFMIRAKSLSTDGAGLRYDLGKAPSEDPDTLGHIHGYLPTNDPNLPPHYAIDGTVLTNPATSSEAVLPNTNAPGIRPDGMYSGYNEPGGSWTVSTITSDEIPSIARQDQNNNETPPAGSVTWQILSRFSLFSDDKFSSTNPAIWETEPKEDIDLDIYYEVGQIYPTELNDDTIEQFVGPIGLNLEENSRVTCWTPNGGGWTVLDTLTGLPAESQDIRVQFAQDNIISLSDINGVPLSVPSPLAPPPQPVTPVVGDRLIFTRSDGSTTEAELVETFTGTDQYRLDPDVHNYQVTLPWHNCYSFGNGVESDRVRDDYNQVMIDNGSKASTTLEEPYLEERRGSGLIYSGLYNSLSGVNNLNQFIAAEKITKDLNPVYGTIQKLHTRNTNLLTLCEDKIFKILADKDALFNADGNTNLTATENVLGQTIPFKGEYGISKNPESFAQESYRTYFTDSTRGAVIRLSQDGITPISDIGMKDWFGDNLPPTTRIIGSFDDKKEEYNITLDYHEYGKWEIHIIGDTKTFNPPYDPTGWIWVPKSYPIHIGGLIIGPGIPEGATIVSIDTISNSYGPSWSNNYVAVELSITPTISNVGSIVPIPIGDPSMGVFRWPTMVEGPWCIPVEEEEDPCAPITVNGVVNGSGSGATGVVMDNHCTSIYDMFVAQGSNAYDAATLYWPGQTVSYVDPANGVVNYFTASAHSGILTGATANNPQAYPPPHAPNVCCYGPCACTDATDLLTYYWEGCELAIGNGGGGVPNGGGPAAKMNAPAYNINKPTYGCTDLAAHNYNELATIDDGSCVYLKPCLPNVTVSFNEFSRGWVSFKSWLHESGVSLNNTYYTFKAGQLFEHHANETRNNFYGEQYDSSVRFLFNEIPGSVKSFLTLNYEGSQSRITPDTGTTITLGNISPGSGEYWDNYLKTGWYVSDMYTDLQQGDIHEFKDKEGKWFSQIKGVTTEWLDDGNAGNIDTNEFSYQGIDESGAITVVEGGYASWECQDMSAGGSGGCSDECCDFTHAVDVPAYVFGSVPPMFPPPQLDWLFANPTERWCDYLFHHISPATQPGKCKVIPGVKNVNGVDDHDPTQNNYWFTYPITLDQHPSHNMGVPDPVLTPIINAWNSQYTFPIDLSNINACHNVNDLLNYLMTHFPGDYQLGMSFSDVWALNGLIVEMHASFAEGTWDGPTLTGTQCIQLNDLSGPYATEEECICAGCNQASTATWNCDRITNTCSDPGDGSGTFSNYDDCVTGCQPCNSLILQTFIVDATIPGCNNGQVTISTPADPGVAWTIEYSDASGVLYSDPNTYTGNTSAAPWTGLSDGSYTAITTDASGCKSPVVFTINCVTSISGCTDPTAINYNVNATIDDGSCIAPVYGCTDPLAVNYFPGADIDDGSCCYVAGCTDNTACNYDANACFDDGSCSFVSGCTDPAACNYDPNAGCDDGSCTYGGCTDPTACNYNPNAACDDGSCLTDYGCTDVNACNYDPNATCDDGSCCYINGCMDPAASNYDPNACCPGPCTTNIPGCTDPNATNYDPNATLDDGSCIYDCSTIPTDLHFSDSPQATGEFGLGLGTWFGACNTCNYFGAYPNNETAIEAIVHTYGISADLRTYRFLRNEDSIPSDDCTASESLANPDCCGTNTPLMYMDPSHQNYDPNAPYYSKWRQNLRISHRSINNWLGYSQLFFNWKDLIDTAVNSGLMTNPQRIYDPNNAGQTIHVGSFWMTYDLNGYGTSFVAVEYIIAEEFNTAGYPTTTGPFEEAMRTNSTPCYCQGS